MKRALVTGANGYVGRWAAADLLKRGYIVHTVARRPDQTSGYRSHIGDVLDVDAMTVLLREIRPSHLLLTAWVTRHGEFWTDPINDLWASASAAVAREFFELGGVRIVLAGTCMEYDWTDPALADGPVREDDAQAAPHLLYGRAKRWAAAAIAELAKNAGGQAAVGRIFFPMGLNEDVRRLLPTIIRSLLADQPAMLGPCSAIRDVIDVRDAGSALAAILDSTVEGPVNIGTGIGIRLSDVAKRVGAILKRSDLIKLGELAVRPNEPASLVAETAKLNGVVGFKSQYQLDTTLADSIALWQSHRVLN